MSTVAAHIDQAAYGDQVTVTHTAYTGVTAGQRTGWVVGITPTHVQVASSVKGTAAFIIPRVNITAWAAARGWRSA